MSNYDPNVIIADAHAKLARGDVAGGQLSFQSALLDWVDDARESQQNESLPDAIATLWIAYAHFLIQAKKYKSAVETYHDATQNDIGRQFSRVWLDFARFYQERGKWQAAQDVYIRALTSHSIADEDDQQLLWSEFLEMMQEAQQQPDLTLEELQTAVQAQQLSGVSQHELAVPTVPLSLTTELEDFDDNTASSSPLTKRIKTEDRADHDAVLSNQTHVVTAEGVDAEAHALLDRVQALPPEISAAWMVRDGHEPATVPLLLFEPTPPKLSDPTGKELLGGNVELALRLNQCLLAPSGGVVLHVARALWALTGLKEQECAAALRQLDATMLQEHQRLLANLDARLSVAGASTVAVQQLNQQERVSFETTCAQQRQQVLAGLAWEFRATLYTQQVLLQQLQVPGFANDHDGAAVTVDDQQLSRQRAVCAYLHSAFYLRTRIGEAPHVTMLQKQVARLEKERNYNDGGSTSYTPPPVQNPQHAQFDYSQLPPPPMPQQASMYNMYGMPPQQMMIQGQLPPPSGYGGPPPPPYGGYYQ